MKKLTKCTRCERILVSQEEVHAVRGGLYCSKTCAINDLMDDLITNAKALAIEAYDSEAEVVSSEDILSEDLQEVKLTVSYTKVVKVPKNLSKEEAIIEVLDAYHEGLVVAEEGDCDYSDVKCELVTDNSLQVIEYTLEDLNDE